MTGVGEGGGSVERALDGIRVVDLTRHMAGPYGTVVLSDHGAEVIKIESLPNGDPSRRVGTAFVGGESALFLMWNRGKKSVAIDLHSEEGVDLVLRLVDGADVFVQNYRPGVAEEMGLGYERLSAINPRLVYCSVSAFGRGSLAAIPGTDPVVQAMSGVMSVNGEPDSGPSLVGVPIADFIGAMSLVQAVLLALVARERTGAGQEVEVSMLTSVMYALTTRLASYWATGETPARHGGAHSVVAPYERYETSDGWVVAGAWASDGWPRFCQAVGLPSLIEDPRFATNSDRVANRPELNAILGPVFRSEPTEHWRQRFEQFRALFGPILTIPEVVEHPDLEGFTQWVDHPIAGRIRQVAPHLGLSATPAYITGPPPLLGEHTEAVLSGVVGLSHEEIRELRVRGVVGPSADT